MHVVEGTHPIEKLESESLCFFIGMLPNCQTHYLSARLNRITQWEQ